MPNDATHRIINYFALSIFIFLNFYLDIENDPKPIIIFIGSYVLGTEIFSPDLDTRSKPSRRLSIISYPIRILSKHRGLGHNIFIGWFLKLLYIILIGTVILTTAYYIGYDLYNTIYYFDIKIVVAFMIGLFLSNAIHIIVDKIYSI